MQYLLWAVGLIVVLIVVAVIYLLSEQSLRRVRAQTEEQHEEWVTRFERSRQERDEAQGRSAERVARAAERAERSLALQQEAIDLARQVVRNQETIIALLQKLEEKKP
jgi:hypothetical protein